MQEFDPRRPAAIRLGPPVLAAVSGLTAAVLGWQTLHHGSAPAATPTVDAAAVAALQKQAFAQAQLIPARNEAGNIEAAVRRTGVGKDQAQQAVAMLGKAFDTVNIKAGMAFQANITRPLGQQSSAQLMGLSLRIGPATAVTLSRAFDGAQQLHKMEEKILDQTVVASG